MIVYYPGNRMRWRLAEPLTDDTSSPVDDAEVRVEIADPDGGAPWVRPLASIGGGEYEAEDDGRLPLEIGRRYGLRWIAERGGAVWLDAHTTLSAQRRGA